MKSFSVLRGGLLLLALALLQGCFSHWFVDGDVRLQVENRAAVAVRDLALLSDAGARVVWVSDSVAPGLRSRVHEGDWVGRFHLVADVRDSVDFSGDTCWRVVDLGWHRLEGGSVRARLTDSAGIWALDLN